MQRRLYFAAALGLCFFASKPIAHAQQVKADTGGIAIGGNVSGSTINIGVPQEKIDALVKERTRPFEELTAAQRETINLLKDKLDLNERQVRTALDVLGEKDIPPERLAAKLVEIAERFKALLATAFAQPGDSPGITGLKAEAQKAIDAGDLAKADALLADVETEQRQALDRLALNAADTLGRRGDIALTRLRYGEAARHFADAAAVFPPGSAHEDKRFGYLEREADALYRQGVEFGDNAALRSAIERRRRLVDLNPRERVPRNWAMTQNNLGIALWRLGERESGTARLDEAVAAYREALKERTRERVPLQWAQTQNNLGSALWRLGERESGTARLDEAVTAYREALKEWTHERVPLQWAGAQTNLGLALQALGERESGTARFDEAVAAFRAALKERTRERVPLEWATTQNSLGNALSKLGQRESGTARLDEAVAAYREALNEFTRERVPLQWATSTGNQGVALMRLAERMENAIMARTAVAQIESALETMHGAGLAPSAAYLEARLREAQTLEERLRKP
jgi:tetratricopeptide (TPR) repeat protein